MCAAKAAPEYSGVLEGTTHSNKLIEFIQCWRIVAQSGQWPVEIDCGATGQAIEFFGEQVKNRLRLLLNKQEPKALVLELEAAVYHIGENYREWIFNNDESFGIAWHLNALSKYREDCGHIPENIPETLPGFLSLNRAKELVKSEVGKHKSSKEGEAHINFDNTGW